MAMHDLVISSCFSIRGRSLHSRDFVVTSNKACSIEHPWAIIFVKRAWSVEACVSGCGHNLSYANGQELPHSCNVPYSVDGRPKVSAAAASGSVSEVLTTEEGQARKA